MRVEITDEIQFANLKFTGLRKSELLELPEDFRQIVTVNAEFIVEANQNERLKKIIDTECSTFDGQIPFVLSKCFNSGRKYEKISGSDLIFDFSRKYTGSAIRFFLLGAAADSNKLAVNNLRQQFQLEIAGYSPPYSGYPFPEEWNRNTLEAIRQFRPQVLFVGFGAMKQEYWINENREELQKYGVKIAVGCGGSIDFAAGKITRAPKLLQKTGLEGVYRLLVEPKKFRFVRLLKSFAIFRYIGRKYTPVADHTSE